VIGAIVFLALEGNSPLPILYAIPPLSMFRDYGRFLVFAFFLLTLLAGYMFEKLRTFLQPYGRMRILITLAILVISVYDVWQFAGSYNPAEAASVVLNAPKTAQFLHSVHPTRIYSLDMEKIWGKSFITTGWTNPNRYVYLLNGLNADVNILYSIPQASVYSGLILQKQGAMDTLVHQNLDIDTKANTASFSAVGTNMLEMLAADYVIAPYAITNPQFTEAYTVPSPYPDIPAIRIYHLTTAKQLYYIAHRPLGVMSYNEIVLSLADPSFGEKYDAILADNRAFTSPSGDSADRITATVYSDTRKTFTYTSDRSGYFMLSTYMYPGWQARLDGKRVPIQGANVYAMAVAAPKGTHTLAFTFVPMTIYIGAGITALTLVIYAGIIIGVLYRKRA